MNIQKVFDLTQPLRPNIPGWEATCGYHEQRICDHDSEGFRVYEYRMSAHSGTHLDAPLHRIPGAKSIGDLAPKNFFAPLSVIDVTAKATKDYIISMDDINIFEKQFGSIAQGDFVLFHTGWCLHWEDTELYRSQDSNDIMHFPSISVEVATYLKEKDVTGIGVDTLSPDTGKDGFPVHDIILGADKIIVENMFVPKGVPQRGAYSITAPLNFVSGTESPIRALAVISA